MTALEKITPMFLANAAFCIENGSDVKPETRESIIDTLIKASEELSQANDAKVAAPTRTQGADARPVACYQCGGCGDNKGTCIEPNATRDATPAADDAQPVAITDEQIRAVFMVHGFTVKEGQTELKPYVYAAARALLATRDATRDAAPTDAQDAERYRWLSERFIGCDFDWMPSAENAGDGKSVLCFEIGRDCRVWGDAGMTIDAAIAASIAATQRDK